MKKLSVFIAIAFFAGTVSVFAQTQPKSAKQATKKECKKGGSCCSDKTASPKTSAKKN